MLKLAAATVLCVIAQLATTESRGAGEFQVIGGKKFYLSTSRATGDEAALACQELGMSLVSLESAEKYLDIKQAQCDGSGSDWVFWTSGKRVVDHFEWTAGSAAGQVFDYTAWSDSEPNQLESPYDICVYFTCFTDWADDPCFFSYAYVCE